jgi:ferrous iron transport protein B
MNSQNHPAGSAGCESCSVRDAASLLKLGVNMDDHDYVVALAGNPNTGKSTVFNALTGLRQHTGNWPGKTVARAEGAFAYGGQRYKVVDLPGTYSLMATSLDEEIASDFILYGRPDVTVVVVDATHLERNLNLVFQILEITDRVVVCLNLIDEARRHGLEVNDRRLARDLGVPVAATVARSGVGLEGLLGAIGDVATGRTVCRPRRVSYDSDELGAAISQLTAQLRAVLPGLHNVRWVALRLLDGDERVENALRAGEIDPSLRGTYEAEKAKEAKLDSIFRDAERLRYEIGNIHQRLMEALYAGAAEIADDAVSRSSQETRFDFDRAIDRVVTSRVYGFPTMLLMLTAVFWITIWGANVPSEFIAAVLIEQGHPLLKGLATSIGLPWWLSGVLIDGMYLATAWVVSVMLPPMAIFFPIFTLLEDLGYLPRVAFNLDYLFKKAGAHGKQALTLAMGFGCNAAGVIATRIIDSPRERLIAIITNNFSLCNGRWPTQILLATIFIGALAPAHVAGLISAFAVVGIAVLGIFLTFVVSWALSRTVLRGESSTFTLELPPYRRPRILQTLYTSLIDRTIFVLYRAVVFAMPAGAAIWLLANIHVGQDSLAGQMINLLNPFGSIIGLSGIILLAYIIAIPANEIVIPSVLMLSVLVSGMTGLGAGPGVLFELESGAATLSILEAGGFTILIAVNLMLFSLIHNPCSTTLYTIYKETGSLKWTTLSGVLPLLMGFGTTFAVTHLYHLFAAAFS